MSFDGKPGDRPLASVTVLADYARLRTEQGEQLREAAERVFADAEEVPDAADVDAVCARTEERYEDLQGDWDGLLRLVYDRGQIHTYSVPGEKKFRLAWSSGGGSLFDQAEAPQGGSAKWLYAIAAPTGRVSYARLKWAMDVLARPDVERPAGSRASVHNRLLKRVVWHRIRNCIEEVGVKTDFTDRDSERGTGLVAKAPWLPPREEVERVVKFRGRRRAEFMFDRWADRFSYGIEQVESVLTQGAGPRHGGR